MTLIEPREALAEQSDFIGYLVGLAGLGRLVHTLTDIDRDDAVDVRDADDFVCVLLGLAGLGAAIEAMADSAAAPPDAACESATDGPDVRWLR